MDVYDKIFAHEALRNVVLNAEREWLGSSPFSGIYKLQAISKLCKASVGKMEWLLKVTVNRIKAGLLSSSDFSIRHLSGRPHAQLGDIFLMQKQMHDHLLGQFLDSRGFSSEVKQQFRDIFQSPESYVEKLRPLDDAEELDLSFMAAWPRSAQVFSELVETASFSKAEDGTIKTGLKHSKTAEEMLKEYAPYKDFISNIDEALEAEAKSKAPAEAAAAEGAEKAVPSSSSGLGLAPAALLFGADRSEEADLDEEAKIMLYAERHCAHSIVLEVEEGKSRTQLTSALNKHAIVKMQSNPAGRIVYLFDINGFGEAVTAPHIRRPPVTEATFKKMLEAVLTARHGSQDAVPFPEGEIFVLIDAGRQSNDMFYKIFGAKPGRKGSKAAGPRNLAQETLLLFKESTVKARRACVRRGVGRKCTQRMYFFKNALTTIPEKQHKHLADLSNKADFYGPISLEAWTELPMMSVSDKKAFWSRRRVSVGGKTITGDSGSDTEAEKADEEEAAGSIELPAVGEGRGSKNLTGDTLQPVVYHELPTSFFEAVLHALSASLVFDMTPQTGRVAEFCVANRLPYVGICQSPQQSEFVLARVLQGVKKLGIVQVGSEDFGTIGCRDPKPGPTTRTRPP